MNQLLRTEWLKIKKYPAFWWMAGIVAISYPAVNYMFEQFYEELTQRGDQRSQAVAKMLIGNPFTFPEVWHTVAYFSSVFVFIPAIVVIMFITNEYTYKTHRQNVIDGWSRVQFMQAKLADVLIISLLATLVYVLVALTMGYAYLNEGSGHIWNQSKYILFFFLQTFAQLSIAFLIAFLTRKAFIALGIFIFYKIAEKIFALYASAKLNDIGRFLPLEVTNRTTPPPAFIGRFNADWYNRALAQVTPHAWYTLVLLVVVWGICFMINKRRDL